MKGLHLCRHTSLDDLSRKDRKDYQKVKALVLEIGRFSVFDAYDDDLANNLTRLCQDPEVETDKKLGYPWTGVKKKRGEAK